VSYDLALRIGVIRKGFGLSLLTSRLINCRFLFEIVRCISRTHVSVELAVGWSGNFLKKILKMVAHIMTNLHKKIRTSRSKSTWRIDHWQHARILHALLHKNSPL
jgi:hypothetical protein